MEYTLLCACDSREETMIIESILVAEGIGCKVEQESIGRLYNLSQNGLGEMKVFVDAAKVKEAEALLDAALESAAQNTK